ncbi:MAG TPA: alkaline phosphatase family protein [Candidatus Sulfotelmatobacter sp.]|jgi:predicted AlkP superfamily phosphohydrolase/phosphomutase/Flp pilus assembly protein TadD|nr:alkaline phosphatase family protein [Candidatus Sulfotelmatobacter sp.]
MPTALAKKVLLIGWDAADWKIANPLLDSGLMPTLDGMISDGVMGNIATLQPILSPMLWNSIATGKRPHKHGIHGFMEPDPHTGGVRPVSSTSRKVKALWNILTQRGYKTHVLGWFAGHPAEPINGVAVSDLYPHATAAPDKPWDLPTGAVHPENLRDTFAKLRMHPAELTEEAILPWIPLAGKVNQEKDRALNTFAKILTENCSIHNAATWILKNEPWDFLSVYYNGIDHFCHAFMNYRPPRMEGIPEERFEIYKDVVDGAYRFHDMMLETLLTLAGPEATVILVSDHGFHSDHLRPKRIPSEPAGPAVQHRPFGIFCMKGPHIKKDERIYGATLLDVTPTVLTLFGLPVGEDMDGRVLVQAFEETPEIERIASWENEKGECGMHSGDMRMDPAAAQAVLEQFVALGYIQPQTENQEKAVASAVRECKYNLSRDLMDCRQYHNALPLLEELARESPKEMRFKLQLAQCYLSLDRRVESKALLQEVLEFKPEPPQKEAKANGNELAEASPEKEVEIEKEEEQAKAQPAQQKETASRAWADWLVGTIELADGKPEEGLAALLRAEQAEPLLPNLHLRLGETYLRCKRIDDAKRAFQRALEIDGDSPEAHVGLSMVHLRQRRFEEAASEALLAVSLQHFAPLGHFNLGIALARLGQRDRAVLAFETSLTILPGLAAAHRWLGVLYSGPGGDAVRAARHKYLFDVLRQQGQQAMRNKAQQPNQPAAAD